MILINVINFKVKSLEIKIIDMVKCFWLFQKF